MKTGNVLMRGDYLILVLGVILSLILSMLLGMFTGAVGSYAGLLVGSGLVGFLLSDDIGWAAFYGALVCIITGVLAFCSMIVMGVLFNWGSGLSVMEFGWGGIIIGLLLDGIVGAVGGIIGSLLNY